MAGAKDELTDGEWSAEAAATARTLGLDTEAAALSVEWPAAREQFLAYCEDYAWSRALEAVWAMIARVDKL